MKEKRGRFGSHFDDCDYESEFEFEYQKDSKAAAVGVVLFIFALIGFIWALIKGGEILCQIL